jgi:hypothetical protein
MFLMGAGEMPVSSLSNVTRPEYVGDTAFTLSVARIVLIGSQIQRLNAGETIFNRYSSLIYYAFRLGYPDLRYLSSLYSLFLLSINSTIHQNASNRVRVRV